MKFSEFQQIIEQYPLFTTNELRLILREKYDQNIKNQIKKWTDLNYLIKLKKSTYLLNKKEIIANLDLAYLATKIYYPSYISLEYALSYYGIIPEAVNTVTSITTRKTVNFKNKLGEYAYHHLSTKAFLGFVSKQNHNFTFQIAYPEKALADYLYFNRQNIILNNNYWDSLRLNLSKNFKLSKLKIYSKYFNNKKLEKIIANFIQYARLKFY